MAPRDTDRDTDNDWPLPRSEPSNPSAVRRTREQGDAPSAQDPFDSSYDERPSYDDAEPRTRQVGSQVAPDPSFRRSSSSPRRQDEPVTPQTSNGISSVPAIQDSQLRDQFDETRQLEVEAIEMSSNGSSSRTHRSLKPSISSDPATLTPNPGLKRSSSAPRESTRRGSRLNPLYTKHSHLRQTSNIGPFDDLPAIIQEAQADPFERAFVREGQIASVNPFDDPVSENGSTSTRNPSIIVTDEGGDTLRPFRMKPAYLRSQSHSPFRNPFRSISEDGSRNSDMPKRPSAPRRPSNFKRVMSVGRSPNPIPKRYRSKSLLYPGFFLGSKEHTNSRLPLFEDDIQAQKENMQEYLAGVEILQAHTKRKPWQSTFFHVAYFFTLICVIYFVFVGKPLWKGVGVLYYNYIRHGGITKLGCLIFIGWAAFQAFLPLFGTRFEQEVDSVEERDASEVALIIPAYKAALVLPETIKAALKIFKPEQIFVVANGNSETPLDNAADVCKEWGVNHAWVPIGSKITAEFVGMSLTYKYKYIMLIDDDVHLPPNLPIVTSRLKGNTKCIGYTIKSTGADGIKGTFIQQCQDMEYKISGLTRTFCGKYGSATFPHGAIILWDREVCQNLFNVHPGYTISEDWYFGHAARSSGYRIQFCSQVFVETETPPALFKDTSAARGGYGEMTVFKQRFTRWNYFFALRIIDDGLYMLFSWRLGWREIVTKIFVLVEIYDSVMAFLRPFVVVLTLIGSYRLFFEITAALTGMYILDFVIFNTWHLRRKKEMISWKVLPVYMGLKFILLWVSCISVYYGVFRYAKFFSVRHPRVIESRKALEAAYNVRLGTNLVPLDTTIGEVLEQPGVMELADEVEGQKPTEVTQHLTTFSVGDRTVVGLENAKLEDNNSSPKSETSGDDVESGEIQGEK